MIATMELVVKEWGARNLASYLLQDLLHQQILFE